VFELSESDRRAISSFIEDRFGIKMPPTKKILLQTRLQKRATQLGYSSIRGYLSFLFTPQGSAQELDHFAAIVSTHKTEFFREEEHFSVLQSLLLPQLLTDPALGRTHPLQVWSAASSTGEEVYSLAMTIDSFLHKRGLHRPLFTILGTDISQDIVAIAQRAIYSDQALSRIPSPYHHYLMRSKDPSAHTLRIVPELRTHTSFRSQNLMDEHYAVDAGFHIIFCRNVLIYFDKPTQETIIRKLVNVLCPGGFLIIGHAESLSGMTLPLAVVQPTVYTKIEQSYEKNTRPHCR
jgi:chemotaxis protein methyltransferase CheR